MKVLRVIILMFALVGVGILAFGWLNDITPLTMVDKSKFCSKEGIAIHGYDPVSYFNKSPQLGHSSFSTEWSGCTWYFSSYENLDLFKEDPDKYAPQLGGYCAFAVTVGFTADVDPQSYLIENDKLYLFNGEELKLSFLIEKENSLQTASKKWNN